jgi:hypothetical protein
MKPLPRFAFIPHWLVFLLGLVLIVPASWAQTPDGNLALMITSPTPNNYRLTWFGQSGKKFQVQSSPDLFTWSNTGPVITGAGGTITVDDGPISFLQKFYRIRILGPVRLLSTTGMLERSDDGWSHDGELIYHGESGYSPHANPATVPIGFNINFFGVTYSSFFVNNNGNVTFDQELQSYTPLPLQNQGRIIIAPFWGDVDTRPTEYPQTLFSAGAHINGHRSFAITWPNVGYYSSMTDKLNLFQMVLIEREDVAVGDFDIEFNYDKVQWETGEASGGVGGLGGSSVRVGLSNGVDQTIELTGSGVNGALLDTALSTGLIYNSRNSTVPGRYVFHVRAGFVLGAIQVNAGPDEVLAPDVRTTTLSGSAADPSGPLSYQWTTLSGPGIATFSNATVLNSTVTFPTPGDYTLQLTATSVAEPQRAASDTVVITIQ